MTASSLTCHSTNICLPARSHARPLARLLDARLLACSLACSLACLSLCLSVCCVVLSFLSDATNYLLCIISMMYFVTCGPSRYSNWLRAGRSGDRIPVGTKFSAPVQTGPGAHAASCTMGTGSFPEVESGRGVTLTPHPLLVPWSKKE
jgi:hypothetical protein